MSAPDCEICELLGHRYCDGCPGLVYDGYRDSFGRDLCAACRK
jgi:hypothetical protein